MYTLDGVTQRGSKNRRVSSPLLLGRLDNIHFIYDPQKEWFFCRKEVQYLSLHLQLEKHYF